MQFILMLLGLLPVAFAGRTSASSSDSDQAAAGDGGSSSTPVLRAKDSEVVPDTPDATDDQTASETPPQDDTRQDDDPVVSETPPDAPDQSGETSAGGEGTQVAAADVMEVLAGRVTTIAPEGDDIVGVRLLSSPESGTVTVNPDNSLALVLTLSNEPGTDALSYEVTHADGSVTQHDVALDVVEGPQEAGWATGEALYMLASDEDGRTIVEAGDDHHTIYVTGSSDALSAADIAALEGVSSSEVTGSFLLEHGYGLSEDLALDEDLGKAMFNTIAPKGTETSTWMLYERGYDYDGLNVYTSGQSELHPILVGAWGEGERPVFDNVNMVGASVKIENIVFQDIHIQNGGSFLLTHNILFDNIEVSGTDASQGLTFIQSSGITVRNSYIHDFSNPEKAYASGLFSAETSIMIENSVFDHNGWTEDFFDQPDPMSHNIYIAEGSFDVMVRDTISMRAAANGLLMRPGGFIEDNVFIENNGATATAGGAFRDDGTGTGHYTLYSGNLVTEAGYNIGEKTGVYSGGLEDKSSLASFIDNIVAHHTDPDSEGFDPDAGTHSGFYRLEDAVYDDTIVWNWTAEKWFLEAGFTGQNTEGLDPDAMNATTIHDYIGQLIGKESGTVDDLVALLEAGVDIEADDILAYFREGFGIAADIRTDAETLRFVPTNITDGVRWDNRLNWDQGDLPGTVAGDSADLGGNHVLFGTQTATIDELALGGSGRLEVYGGKLTATGGLAADENATIEVREAGQFWIDGSDGGHDIDVSGGRFANTGYATGDDLTVSDGQAILATDGSQWEVGSGRTLAIFDAAAKVGFDGEDGGMAILDLDEGSTLSFVAGEEGLGTIEEIRSGAMGDAPNVLSGIDLEGATLEIDVTGLDAGTAFTLMSADEIAGALADAQVTGLGANDAKIVVNYKTDSVTLQLSAGSGQVSISTIGAEDNAAAAHDALWEALTADHGLADDTAPIFDEDGDLLVA